MGKARVSSCLALGGLCLCAGLLSVSLGFAQEQSEEPLLQLGITTGVATSSNRGLDVDRTGSTTELTSRLDFLTRFATPIQELEFSGDIGLRSVTGAEDNSLPDGIFEPRLALAYSREARDARLTADLFFQEQDISSSELQFNENTADFDLLEDTGTQQRVGGDVALELRRQSPFGVTLSAGFTTRRFSDADDPDLTDQDRFRLGARFRFNLAPDTQAFLNTRFSTFEDFGTAEGRRETFSIDGTLRRDLANGNAVVRSNVTDTEDGTRYTLSAGRTIESAAWAFTGLFGVTRGVTGRVRPTGEIDVSRSLRNGELSANLTRTLRSNVDDEEQDVTTVRLGYTTQLSPLTGLNTSFSFTDRDSDGGGDDGSFGVVSLGIQRAITRDWDLNVALQHRLREEDEGDTARDNRLSITLRRDLLVRR
ncbi:hypothetical protein [Tateyamaria sp. ANG-S1]|uniref:hypothetical protein n=1 Tax=Tateyamaria sp. ANG-S1 TaxID=1577905 RepID=UPI00187C9571|nr:hypothetical protein [Tateyamaria sp. ANG-S1]